MNDLEHNLRRQLLSAEQQLDDATLRRLRRARNSALAAASKPRLPRLMIPALGMATASIVALLLVMTPPEDGLDTIGPDNASFYEDLEFYYWLAESDAARRS